jgi:hypothetical protein
MEEAAGSSLLLANGSYQYTDSQGSLQIVYGLAQCTRDLNTSESSLEEIFVSLVRSRA